MKKLLALLLALLMLVPFVVSCANNNSDSDGESTTKSTASENGTNETDTGEKVDVPDTKYGKDLTFLCFNDSGEWSVVDIYTEKDSDDVLKSAIFQRNLYLKDTYDVTIKEVQEKDIAAKAKTEQASNSNAYQAYIAPLNTSAALASQSYLYDLASGDVPYINLSKSWWDQSANAGLSIGNQIYFATGDLLTIDNDATFILMFNKKMVENMSGTLTSPYELVTNNQWTLAKFREMVELARKDLDGNAADANSYKNDQFGLAGGQEMVLAFFYASNMTSATKDADDLPVFALSNKNAQTKADDYFKWAKEVLYNKESTVIFHEIGTGSNFQDAMDCFTTNRSLFYGECLQCVTRMRKYNIDFGIIPYPKYDENQDNYYGYVNTVAQVVAVPKTNTGNSLEMTGATIEAMAAKSQSTLTKAYYDINLISKGTKDTESEPMLTIILENRIFDLGYVYEWGKLVSGNFITIAKSGNGFSSKVKTYERSYNKGLNETLKAFKLK